MKKRIFALLCAALLAVGVSVPAQADPSAGSTLTVSSSSAPAGGQAEVTVTLESDRVYAGNFSVRYDPAALELAAALGEDPGMMTVNDRNPGEVYVSFTANSPLERAELLHLTFRVLAEADPAGSAVTLSGVRMYDNEGNFVDTAVHHGGVAKSCVRLGLSTVQTAEAQAVRVEVTLSGELSPLGGNFAVTYDPAVLVPTAVLPLASAQGRQLTWRLEDGAVRIALAGTEPIPAGALCAVMFRAVGQAGSSTDLAITDVRTYDENARPMDTAVTGGLVQVVVPVDRDLKLWVVGGAIQPDGSTALRVVLHGRGKAAGGQFVLEFPNHLTVSAKLTEVSGVLSELVQEQGLVKVSWAGAFPLGDDVTLLELTVTGGREGDPIAFRPEECHVKDGNGGAIQVLDLRSSALTGEKRVQAVVDGESILSDGITSRVTVTVDVADLYDGTAGATEGLISVLAVYNKVGKLTGLDMDTGAELTGGTGELTLSLSARGEVADCNVLLMSREDASALCPALHIDGSS